MASGRCSGGGGDWSYRAVLGCLGGEGDDDARDDAPDEVREVALEPVSPSRAGETYEQHLARARSPRRPPPRDAAGDDDSGDEILRSAAARWPPPPSDPRPAATSGDASRPPPPAATVCKPCAVAPDGASEDPRSHRATGGRAYEI
jgi:hypothetical protein